MNNAAANLKSIFRSLVHNSMALAGTLMLVIAIFTAIFAPWIAPYDPKASLKVSIDDIYAAPSLAHPFGTDDAGRDVLSNFIYGARISLIVGFFASFISVFIGGSIGIVAGF